MLRAIFTLDYEIHGNGEGCPHALMIEPTNRMMDLFDAYGAKLTIMADVAEILKFGEYKKQTGRDDYYFDAIVAQLRDAIRRGHDVQLHLHASYFNARAEGGRWVQDWSDYNFAGLPRDRMDHFLSMGKKSLEDWLKPVAPGYQCMVFRAANWAMSPSRNVVQALVNSGFKIDTSVFKYGHRAGLVNFDYQLAPSALVPWQIDENDICAQNGEGELLEFPIYCEKRWIGAFLTPQRIYRACVGRLHRVALSVAPEGPSTKDESEPGRREILRSSRFSYRPAWKADFNQCSGKQLIRAMERAERIYESASRDLPFVLIGHSKLFTGYNETSLRPLLSMISGQPDRFGFACFNAFDLRCFGSSR